MNNLKSSDIMRKKRVFLSIIIIPFIGLIALMIAAGNGQTPAMQTQGNPPLVSVISVSLAPHYSERSVAIGQVEAIQQSVIGFDRAGQVTQILVDEGQRVEAGQVLAEQDQQRIRASMQELAATLSRAQADLRLAELSAQRVADLVSKNLESSQRLDEVRASKAAASALVAEVMARQASLAVELDKTRLVAPYTAMVKSRAIDQGAVVNAGQAVLVLEQQDGLQARFALPAAQALQFSVGDSSQLGFAQQQLTGKVKSIAQQRNAATRTVDVIFSLEASNSPLMAGDLLSLSRQQQIDTQGLWVPRSALISGVRGLWSLFVVEQNAKGQEQLVSKLVEIAYVDEEQVYVSGAIAEGAKVVVEGIHKLVPNQIVQSQVIRPAQTFSEGESAL